MNPILRFLTSDTSPIMGVLVMNDGELEIKACLASYR